MQALNPVAANQQAGAVELFGSFILGDDEFALPASSIREVVNFPDKISALPLAPPFLEGMFTLRGSVIPVVNLGRVFQPDAPRADKSHKIAIVDFQQVLVGILFHATGEVLRVRPDQRSTLSYPDGAQGVVAGTILLNDGERLIQVLNPAALISIENVPHVLAMQAACQKQQRQHFQNLAARRRCVSFHAGGASFAFDMSGIQEIINVPEIHGSLLNNQLCLGRINFRGSPVGVVDFAHLLADEHAGHKAAVATAEERIIVVRIDNTTVGFLVDSVDNVIHFAEDDIMPIPMLSKARADMFTGCLSRPELGDVILLDHRRILSHGEITAMCKGHASLYPDEKLPSGVAKDGAKRHSGRQVYITFLLDAAYAVEIRQVREIIDYNGAITCPPGMPDYMRGMLNLRQQMITLIDLRSLYRMPPLAAQQPPKILIVERGTDCYGLIVDAVESIMTIEDSKRFAAPSLMRKPHADNTPRAETDEVIDISDSADGVRKTLRVFDCGSVLEALRTTQAKAA